MRATRAHEDLCQLRADFVEEWGRRYCADPRPPLPRLVRELAELTEADVIGKSSLLGRVGHTLSAVSHDIHQLQEELDRKLLLQNFLQAVISILDYCSEKPRACGEGKLTQVGERERVGRRRDKDDNDDNDEKGKFDPDHLAPDLVHQLDPRASETCCVGRTLGPRSTDGKERDNEELFLKDQTLVKLTANISDTATRPSRPHANRDNGKFVSRIEVRESSGNAPDPLPSFPRPKEPTLSSPRRLPHRSPHRCAPGVEEAEEENIYDNVLVLNTSTQREVPAGVEEEEEEEEEEEKAKRNTMFRRSKTSGRQGEDGSDSPPHSLGSKDNFLAVTSRRTVRPVETGRQDGLPESPLLNRHFKMLKLTRGFDLVMDEDNTDENKNESPVKLVHTPSVSPHTNPSTPPEVKRHRSIAPGDKNSGSESQTFVAKNRLGGANNNIGKQNDDITSSSSPRAEPPSGETVGQSGGVTGREGRSVDKLSCPASVVVVPAPGEPPSPVPPGSAGPGKLLLSKSVSADGVVPMSRTAVSRGSGRVPPPVAKKPARSGSSKWPLTPPPPSSPPTRSDRPSTRAHPRHPSLPQHAPSSPMSRVTGPEKSRTSPSDSQTAHQHTTPSDSQTAHQHTTPSDSQTAHQHTTFFPLTPAPVGGSHSTPVTVSEGTNSDVNPAALCPPSDVMSSSPQRPDVMPSSPQYPSVLSRVQDIVHPAFPQLAELGSNLAGPRPSWESERKTGEGPGPSQPSQELEAVSLEGSNRGPYQPHPELCENTVKVGGREGGGESEARGAGLSLTSANTNRGLVGEYLGQHARWSPSGPEFESGPVGCDSETREARRSSIGLLVAGSSRYFVQAHTSLSPPHTDPHTSLSPPHTDPHTSDVDGGGSEPSTSPAADSQLARTEGEEDRTTSLSPPLQLCEGAVPRENISDPSSPSAHDTTRPLSAHRRYDNNDDTVETSEEFPTSSCDPLSPSLADDEDGEVIVVGGRVSHVERCGSSDTLVSRDRGRSDSFTSDLDVKDAIRDLENVIRTERTDSMDDSSPTMTTPTTPTTPSTYRPSRAAPAPHGQTRGRARPPSYENWTINRAVTASLTQPPDFVSVSDEDELEDLGPHASSPSPLLQRHGAKGSTDSGLCDDMGAVDTGQISGAAIYPAGASSLSTCSGSSEQQHQLEVRGERLRDLRMIHAMSSCAEEGQEEEEERGIEEQILAEEAMLDRDIDRICKY